MLALTSLIGDRTIDGAVTSSSSLRFVLATSQWVCKDMDQPCFFDYSRFGGTEYEQDWEEPLLSVYNYASIRVLQGQPYDASWQAVLSTINPVSLYKLLLTSETMFELVMAHVRAVQPSSGSHDEHLVGSAQDRLSSLPNELLCVILARLNLVTRLSLHRTCKKLAALCARELQAGVARVLTSFGLCHAEIRFMQSATMAAIGGHCIPHLVHYKALPEFFTLLTGLEATPLLLNNLYVPEGYDDCADFGAAANTPRSIRVVRSITNSALDSITYSPFSHLFGAVTHLGLWLAYPDSSINKVTMPNRECIDFDDPATEDRVISSFEHFSGQFTLDFCLSKPHSCGSAWDCPTTARSTADAGCLSLFFPSLPSGWSSKPDTVYPTWSCMPWTLGDRRRADVFRANKMFLTNAVHGLDFGATRDCTFQGAACWSFKRCTNFDVNMECPWRYPVRPYETKMFGQVDFIEDNESGSIVRLGRPTGVSCRLQHSFDNQIVQLQRMVEEDHDHSGAVATSDWFSPSFAGSRYSREEGCFYISVGRFVGASTAFKVGDNLELEASFRFAQADFKRFTVTVIDIWSLGDSEIGKRGDGYTCDINPGLAPLVFTEYTQAAKRSLAFSHYPDDLVATRDRSSAAGSSFSFKDLTSNASHHSDEPGVVWPGRGKRGSEKHFQCNIFGEVRSTVTMEHAKSISVELGRPTRATCAVVGLWEQQLRALREIVKGDSVDVGGACRGSWFALEINIDYRPGDTFRINFVAAPTNNYSTERMYCDLVDMMKTGQVIDALVWFQRFDIARGPGEPAARNYYAAARRVTRLPVDAVSRKKDSYDCDILDYEQEAGLFTRGELETYTPSFFGQVAAITRGANAHIKIKCPDNMRCSVKRKYRSQMAQLKATVDSDNIQLGGRVGSSWFADEANGMMQQDGCAYIKPWGNDADWELDGVVPGTLIGSWAQLIRKDSGIRELRRDYKLCANFFVVVVPDAIDLRGAGYQCDFGAWKCDFF
ncbi:hypothetical protein B0H16DRAFT_1711225 [Mycena metata]|uniref:F-box domain-containing protein n=1 Tax=Mycena metata TaxID=1033252 RepID=A0AAD7NY65_9AGAR|nr:hypothetical protein B0H16DRAFT_1711225 [Mycena metata]